MKTFRVTNMTHWSTKDLRRIIGRIFKDELQGSVMNAKTGLYLRDVLVITIKYNRQVNHNVTGNAYYGGPVNLLLPSQSIELRDLGYTIAHEFAHVRGLDHKELKGSVYMNQSVWHRHNEWIDNEHVWKTVAKPRPDRSVVFQKKLTHAASMLKRAQRKAKLAATIVKRWKRRVSYYERQLATPAVKAAAKRAVGVAEVMETEEQE